MLIGAPWGIKLPHGKISLGSSGLNNVKKTNKDYTISQSLVFAYIPEVDNRIQCDPMSL